MTNVNNAQNSFWDNLKLDSCSWHSSLNIAFPLAVALRSKARYGTSGQGRAGELHCPKTICLLNLFGFTSFEKKFFHTGYLALDFSRTSSDN